MAQDFGDDLLTLVDDDGQEHEFQIVDTLEHDDDRYVALVASYAGPALEETPERGEGAGEEDGELVVLKAVTEGEEEFLEAIEEEAEFDEVAALFMERLEDDFDFIAGEEEEDLPEE